MTQAKITASIEPLVYVIAAAELRRFVLAQRLARAWAPSISFKR